MSGGEALSLFQLGNFTLSSGIKSNFKVECDALTRDDWDALGALVREIVPEFCMVLGVPTGGLGLAEALSRYSGPNGPILLVDDVLTTGASMENLKARVVNYQERPIVGVVAFARGQCPSWITPLWQGRGGEA